MQVCTADASERCFCSLGPCAEYLACLYLALKRDKYNVEVEEPIDTPHVLVRKRAKNERCALCIGVVHAHALRGVVMRPREKISSRVETVDSG